jgi:SNF2 family DNA or RNA helicase
LGAVQRLRVVCSLAKISATVEVAKKVLEKEPAVVVFTSFVQVAKHLYQHLADSGWQGELLTGETPAKKRQAMVDNFQVSAKSSCAFLSFKVLSLIYRSVWIRLDCRPFLSVLLVQEELA